MNAWVSFCCSNGVAGLTLTPNATFIVPPWNPRLPYSTRPAAAVDAGEEVERRTVPRFRLIAVGEVARRREHHQLRALHQPVHHLHGRERRITVAADQEHGRLDRMELVGDVIHSDQG